MMDAKDEPISATTIPTVTLNDKVKEFTDLSRDITNLEAEVAISEYALRAWLSFNGFCSLAAQQSLTDFLDEMIVYKPPVAPEIDQEKTDANKKAYSDLVSDLVTKRIKLQNGRTHLHDVREFVAFLKEIGGLFRHPQKPQGGGKPEQQ